MWVNAETVKRRPSPFPPPKAPSSSSRTTAAATSTARLAHPRPASPPPHRLRPRPWVVDPGGGSLPFILGSMRLNMGAFLSMSGMMKNRILLPRM